MVPSGIWSKYDKITRFSLGSKSRRKKGAWRQRPKDDRQPPIRKTAAEVEKISQHGQTGERLLWRNFRSSWKRTRVKRPWRIWRPTNCVNDIFSRETKNCFSQCADDWHYMQLLQRNRPYGQRLWKTQKEKRKRCPTRQVNSEKNLSWVWDMWQEKPSRGKVLARCRCTPQTQTHQIRGPQW